MYDIGAFAGITGGIIRLSGVLSRYPTAAFFAVAMLVANYHIFSELLSRSCWTSNRTWPMRSARRGRALRRQGGCRTLAISLGFLDSDIAEFGAARRWCIASAAVARFVAARPGRFRLATSTRASLEH
jgi:hypothetical protein